MPSGSVFHSDLKNNQDLQVLDFDLVTIVSLTVTAQLLTQ